MTKKEQIIELIIRDSRYNIDVEKTVDEIFSILCIDNYTILDELFYECVEKEPNLSREEFNEVLKLWLYRWEKDKQVEQIIKDL